MDAKKESKDPSELAQALQVISSISRGLPSPIQPEAMVTGVMVRPIAWTKVFGCATCGWPSVSGVG